MLDNIFKGIVTFIVLCALGLVVTAGAGAVGGFALAGALGAGKAMSLAAAGMAAIGAPIACVAGWMGVSSIKKKLKEHKRASARPSFNNYSAPAPAPVSAPQPPAPKVETPARAADETPTVFVDALSKMKELPPDERRKYFDRLRDAFPNEVESLGGFNEQMALAHEAPTMKKLTLIKPPEKT